MSGSRKYVCEGAVSRLGCGAGRGGGISEPKISIIVPVYNVEKYLRRCLDSILAQIFTEFECVLVEDCSLDGSAGICDEYAAKDARVRVIHNGRNLGSSISRKVGVEASSAPYIQFVDSDDWIESEMTGRLYARAQKEKADIVFCDYVIHGAQGKTYVPSLFDARGIDKDAIVKAVFSHQILWSLWNKLYTRHLFDGITFPKYNNGEDVAISLQLFINAKKIGYEYSILYHWCFNPTSLCRSSEKRATRLRLEGYRNNSQFLLSVLKEAGLYEPHKADYDAMMLRLRKSLALQRAFWTLMPWGVLRMLGYTLRKRRL